MNIRGFTACSPRNFVYENAKKRILRKTSHKRFCLCNDDIRDENILQVVNEEKFCSHLKLSLTKIISDEGFLTFKLETNFIQPSGGNYLGELYEVQITGNTIKGYKVINLFIKTILPFENNMDFISFKDVYLREIFVYNKMSAIFEELQTTANIPNNEKYKLVKSYDTGNENALIMENMRIRGFKVPERMEIPSLSFSETAMKELAKFHTLSFVMKKETPEFFEKEVKSKKYLFDFNGSWLGLLDNSMKTAIDSIESDEAKEKVNKYVSISNFVNKYEHFMKAEDINIGVFCHGDYRTQNILMREKDGVTLDIVPVDYQITYYGHPVNDIAYYLAGATDHEFRKKHMDHLKNVYYNTMKDFLLYFDMEVQDVYPREQYEQDFRERIEYGLLVGLHYFPFFFASEDDIPDLSMDLTTKKLATSDIYRKCINELIEDFIDWGYL